MTKQEIINFYKQYKIQILNEMKEYLDIPLKNINKIGKYDYIVEEDGIEAKFTIRPKYFSDSHKGYQYFSKNVDKTYEISWLFTDNTTNRTPWWGCSVHAPFLACQAVKKCVAMLVNH